MAEPAEMIEVVVRPDGTADFLVDGQEFPWDADWEGLTVEYDGVTQMVKVSLTLQAKRAITRLQGMPINQDTSNPESSSPGMWDVGWEFNGGEAPSEGPPDRVKCLECLEDNSDWPILRRVGPNLWAWFTRGQDQGDLGSDDWHTWMSPGLPWSEKRFRVIESDPRVV